MSALIDILLGDTATLALGGSAVAVMAGAVAWRLARARALAARAAHVAFLALDGRAEEARIHARSEARALAPLLAALGGELAPPPPGLPAGDLAAALGVHALPALALAVGLHRATAGAPAERVAAVVGTLALAAALLPLAAGCAVAVVSAGQASARAIRGSSAALLAQAARGAAQAELAESLRRSAIARDPRGA